MRATQVIMHSMAAPGTTPEKLIRYWSQPGTPLERHFIVGRDGRAWLRFSDGAEVVASGDHLWVTWTRDQRHHDDRRGGERYRHRGPKPIGYPDEWAAMRPPRTTDEPAATTGAADGHFDHAIPLARPLRHPGAALPVDP